MRTVIEASRNPVTLDKLIAQLDGLAPALAEAPPEEGALGWLSRELRDSAGRSVQQVSPVAGD